MTLYQWINVSMIAVGATAFGIAVFRLNRATKRMKKLQEEARHE